MAITEWTSEGMVWDSIADIENQPSTVNHIEAVRLATVERLLAIGVAPDPILSTPVVQHDPTYKKDAPYLLESLGKKISRSIFFDTYMNTNLDYIGERYATEWTPAAILAHIGDASILEADRTFPLSAAWLYQKYKLLNSMIWTSQESEYSQTYLISKDQRKATSAANWPASTWAPLSTGSGAIKQALGIIRSSGSHERRRMTMGFTGIPTDFEWYGDLLLSSGIINTATYSEQGSGWDDSTWNLLEHYTQNNDGVKTFTIGDIDAAPTGTVPGGSLKLGFDFWLRGPNDGDAERIQGNDVYGPLIVRKYDGPGGFSFKSP